MGLGMAFEHFLCFLFGDFDLKFCSKLRRKGYFIKILLFSSPEGTEFNQKFANKRKKKTLTCHAYSAPHPPPPPPPPPPFSVQTLIPAEGERRLRSKGVIALYPLRFFLSPLSQKRLILRRRLAIGQTV